MRWWLGEGHDCTGEPAGSGTSDSPGEPPEDRTHGNPRPHQGARLRRVRGARARHQGRRADRPVPRNRAEEARAEARQHRRHVYPEGAARRHHGRPDKTADDHQRRLETGDQVARRDGGVDEARRGLGIDRGLGLDLRRLRRRGAGVQLGRLQGRRRQRQNDHRSRERSRRSGSVGPSKARSEDVWWRCDDVLRPLDLQVRGRRAQGRRWHPRRPRNGTCGVSIFGGPREPEREVRSRHAGQEHGPRGHRGVGHAGRSQEDSEDGRPGLRRLEEAGRHARLQTCPARAQGLSRHSQHPAHDRFPQRRRKARGQRSRPQGRIRRLLGALGSLRHRCTCKG